MKRVSLSLIALVIALGGGVALYNHAMGALLADELNAELVACETDGLAGCHVEYHKYLGVVLGGEVVGHK